MYESGRVYRGSQSVDSNGNVCKYWSSLTSTEREIMNAQYQPIPGDDQINFCRNLGGADEPWCFLEGRNGSMSDCNVPFCNPEGHVGSSPAGRTL